MKLTKLIQRIAIGGIILFISVFLSPIGAASSAVNTGLEFTSTMPSVYGNIIIDRTGEASIGPRAVDLNNDGDFNDYVVRYYNISTGESFNSGAEAENGVPMLWGANVVFVTREGYVAQDLNGDNDWNDDVAMYYDVSARKLFTTKGETLSIRNPQISGNIIAFVTAENSVGIDLDGDNSISNFVVRYFDIASGALHNTGGTIYSSSNPVVSGNIIAFPTNERDYKTFLDLNGDGDNSDMILRYYDVSSKALVNTGAVMLNFGYDVSGPIIAFFTFEGRIGADLNGDGDISDTVVRYFDVSTGRLVNIGAEVAAGTSLTVKDGLITFISNELFVGSAGKDLNGDGDINDNILRYYDISTGRLVNTGMEAISPIALSNGKIIAFVTDEATVERNSRDLNGDGDMSDRIVRYYDLTTGTTVNTGAETWTELGLSDSIIAFGSAENRVGRFGEDLNGDGDKLDIVLRYISLSPSSSSSSSSRSSSSSSPSNSSSSSNSSSNSSNHSSSSISSSSSSPSLSSSSSSQSSGSSRSSVPSSSSSSSGSLSSSSSSSLPPTDNPPTACIINPNQTAEEGTLVRLDGSCSSDIDGDSLIHQWIQTAGTPVVINNSNQPIADFIAPNTQTVQREGRFMAGAVSVVVEFLKSLFAEEQLPELTFRLTVSANNKSDSKDSVIAIKPKPEPTSVAIVSPLNNQIVPVNEKIILKAQIQGENVKSVYFLIDNQQYRARYNRRENLYYYSWTVPYGYNQTHNIQAQAQSKQRTIIDQNQIAVLANPAPSISLTNPQNNQTVKPKEKITIQANFSPDNNGITKVEFIITDQITNKQVRKQIDRSSSYQFIWRVPTKAISGDTYTIQAIGYSKNAVNREIFIGQSEAGVRVE